MFQVPQLPKKQNKTKPEKQKEKKKTNSKEKHEPRLFATDKQNSSVLVPASREQSRHVSTLIWHSSEMNSCG